MDSATCCPRCNSVQTIRTASESRYDYWHCYSCGKTFDVRHQTEEQPSRRAADTRRQIRY